jgi:hypothetical protein
VSARLFYALKRIRRSGVAAWRPGAGESEKTCPRPVERLRAGVSHKPVRLIVPFSPGGTNDILARMVATHLTSAFGETVIVDNRTDARWKISWRPREVNPGRSC